MSDYYAQKDFVDIQGIDGQYPISEVGSLLTAFCNLAQDFGQGVSPSGLNQIFVDNGLYMDGGDGVLDDLSWNAITHFDPQISLSGMNPQGGWPRTNKALVRFYYRNHNGIYVSHVCKVHDYTQGLIVDSLDKQIKPPRFYGNPIEYVTYIKAKPVSIMPLNAKPADPVMHKGIVYEALPTHHELWAWKSNGASKYYFGDSEDESGFDVLSKVPEFTSVSIVGKAIHPSGQVFWMEGEDFGRFTATGRVNRAAGYKVGDLHEGSPPLPIPDVTPREPTHIPVQVLESTPAPALVDTDSLYPGWRETYEDLPEPTKYVLLSHPDDPPNYTVLDYSNTMDNIIVSKGRHAMIVGFFYLGTEKYGRPLYHGEKSSFHGIPDKYLMLESEMYSYATTVRDAKRQEKVKPLHRVSMVYGKIDHYTARAFDIVKRFKPNK